MKHVNNDEKLNKKSIKKEKNKPRQEVGLEVNIDLENSSAVEDDYIKVSLEIDDKNFYKKQNANSINKFLNKKTDFKVYELILFAVLIMIVSVFLTIVVINDLGKLSFHGSSNVSKNSSDSELLEFEEVYNLINNSYYKSTSKKAMIEGAINGMLGSLNDPHTSYFNKSETDSFNELMNGSYEGIGAEISIDANGNIIVFSVFKNSPAYDAGLKFNDKILEVNKKSTKGMSTTEVVSLIKDINRKTASIKVEREGKTLDFEVEKRIVVIESVESKTYNVNDKKIGYVLINTFANNTYEQFRTHVEDLEKENISGLIIDVRGNTGGYLHSVTNMLDMFLPKGTITYQIADRKNTYKYSAITSESRNYPVAVLVNKSSASASEILAVSLKESYGADVVGTYTYGKGTVQTTKDLKASGGMVKYTIQKWLSPKGNWINELGVEPTILEEQSTDYEKNPIEENDTQLKKALNVISNK